MYIQRIMMEESPAFLISKRLILYFSVFNYAGDLERFTFNNI